MSEAVLMYLRSSLPAELASLTESWLRKLDEGDYEGLLRCPQAQALLDVQGDGSDTSVLLDNPASWTDRISKRVASGLEASSDPQQSIILFCVGYAALLSFIQSNVTGPPLSFNAAEVLAPSGAVQNQGRREDAHRKLLASLSIDGISAYRLTPNLELLCLASTVMSCPAILTNVKAARWAKMRTLFFHQRLLSEPSPSLQNAIYDDLDLLDQDLAVEIRDVQVEFLLERSTVHIHHGLDKLARKDLEQASSARRFDFALTGMLGKRTKYQEKETSQLVVLAKSHADDVGPGPQSSANNEDQTPQQKPTNLELNDDTLLESISFSQRPEAPPTTEFQKADHLSPALKALDPSDQPQLQPLDSIVLLSLASSITNTSPQDGLTREETLPYATRVLEGGSSNWQVYTQALLVRSRIEGYKSRTTERGLLQLQTLVDQVIAETSGAVGTDETNGPQASTFLPKAKESESAPSTERLRYVFQLAPPTRWELEAELAARWVQLGGLRSALDIYERLQMWAEAALCWAATEREDKARRVVRCQLFHTTNGTPEADIAEDENWEGAARDPPPLDAPRLYCILGDIDQSVEMYRTAWDVSGQRYARAQRSLGRHYLAKRDWLGAAEAYSKSLKANQLNHSSWFALGCALLELGQANKAAEAFSRCVQLEEADAESWSNLGAALLRSDPDESAPATESGTTARLDDEDEAKPSTDSKTHQQLRVDALRALKRAASLKHDSYRIWENVMIVAASISPPDYNAILAAQKSVIDIRGKTDGEGCIDVAILSGLVAHIISTSERYDPSQPGLARMTVRFVDESVVPLITGSAQLWQLVSKLALWRNKPSTALDAEEKAWRAVTSQPGWETESEKRWGEVVEATVRLCDAYESLGPKERTEGMGAGELVMKDWKFKARSAVRGITGRGKDSWDGTEGWERLKSAMDELRG